MGEYADMSDREKLLYLDRLHESVEKANCRKEDVSPEVASLIIAIAYLENVATDAGMSDSAIIFRIQNRVLRRISGRSYDPDDVDPEDA